MLRMKMVGALLSRHLKELASQKNEDGKTNAEMLAQKIWDLALGKGPARVTTTGKIVKPSPDKDMIVLLYDRLEGRVGDAETTNKRIMDIPDHVSDVAVEKLNSMSKG